jgi:hypothetical protein
MNEVLNLAARTRMKVFGFDYRQGVKLSNQLGDDVLDLVYVTMRVITSR